ncbi:hypothetical protein [Vibrio crassostreae]|uniref:hypothetical protein n=1 Tax=Vibrio crassostreae TaxID=246167 RepID=UPI001B3130BE|nr:hypothetical protein [Vibrio crassostreae]
MFIASFYTKSGNEVIYAPPKPKKNAEEDSTSSVISPYKDGDFLPISVELNTADISEAITLAMERHFISQETSGLLKNARWALIAIKDNRRKSGRVLIHKKDTTTDKVKK